MAETPEQAKQRKKMEMKRSEERRKNQARKENNIEHDNTFPYISKMVQHEEPMKRAFHHIMKTQIGADEYLTKDMREKIGLNAENISMNKSNNPLLEQIHQSNICVCCDRFIIGTEELNWINKKTLLANKKRLMNPDVTNESLKACYTVGDEELKELLLSPRAREFSDFIFIQYKAYIQFTEKMKEHEVARCTFGLKLKVTGPSFFIAPTFAQRPDFCKNFVMANPSCFYEFGTHRSRGRSKKAQGTDSPKINVVAEKEYFFEEETIDNLVDNFDDVDDDDSSPQSVTRVTRSSSKFREQKPKATYEAETKYKDSDVSIDSSGSIYKPTKKKDSSGRYWN
jgi:hypothetical protein